MRKLTHYTPSLIVLVTAAVILLAGPRAVQRFTYEQTRAQIVQARHSLDSSDVLAQINQAFRDIATVVEPSVVHVSAHYLERDYPRGERLRTSSGSGWIFDEQGHVVTNHHVIQNARRIQVQLYDGYLRDAVLVGSDPTTDVAVIKISPENLHPATLAEVDQPVNQGDLVFAFGSPFDFRFSMSSGVVSGKGRSVGVIRDENGRPRGYENFIQVDAAINPGNSGGPLTDYRGRVIGMNTAIATNARSSTREEGQFAGIGLAIPIEMIYPVVTQLIENGYVTKGYLGVELPDELPAAIAAELGFFGSGTLVRGVEDNSPAAQAGVKTNDIITHVNGQATRSTAQLRSLISSMRPGDTARLRIWRYDIDNRKGEHIEISVDVARLDTLRSSGQVPHDQSRESIPALGIVKMSTNTPELARQFDSAYHRGVLIEEVAANGPLAGKIRAGAVIVDVMDSPVSDVDAFLNLLRKHGLAHPRGLHTRAIQPDGEIVELRLRVQ